MKRPILLLMTIFMHGCAGIDTYRIIKQTYCANVPIEVRQAALSRMQSTIKDYPKHSICDENGFLIDILTPEGDTNETTDTKN
jgi:CheY-like chemotaxis protein